MLGFHAHVLGIQGAVCSVGGEFLNKGAHVSTLTGEKLTERQAVQAVEAACWAGGSGLTHFVLAPHWAAPPFYMLHVDADDQTAGAGSRLAEAVDAELRRLNIEYESKRKSGRLGAVRLNVLAGDTLARADAARRARSRRGRNEQYKHQYLYTQVGQDAEFPVAAAREAGDAVSPR